MSGAMKVKAVLLRDGDTGERSGEVRRFRLKGEEESGVAGRDRFESLLTSVQSVFKVNTATDRCSLFWKGEESFHFKSSDFFS